MKRKILACLILLGALALFLALFLYQVDAREYVVLTQFGEAVKTVDNPGLYWKLPPPIQQVNRLDRRVRIYETKMVEYLTGDKKNLIIQAFVCWRIEDPLLFFEAVKLDSTAEQRLDDVLSTLIGSTLGDFQLSNIFSTQKDDVRIQEMETQIAQGASSRLADSYGMEVSMVGFSRISLPEESANSVYDRMRAERKTMAEQYRSEGKSEAEKIKAEANLEKTQILAEADKQAAIIRGEGDEEAMRIYGQAYATSPEFFRLLKSLEAYRKFLNERTTLVLSAESELFQYLEGLPKKDSENP